MTKFQSPSLRGSGRFKEDNHHEDDSSGFQSPSLRGSGRFALAAWRAWQAETRFNPLHCGAVVASRALSCVVVAFLVRFNPLHCGAVVASRVVLCLARS